VVDNKSSRTLESIAFQNSVVPSARAEPEDRWILRTRGNRVVALCKRVKVSWAGSLEVSMFETVFPEDRALAKTGTEEGALRPVRKDILRLSR
jgi:hypothetical protein